MTRRRIFNHVNFFINHFYVSLFKILIFVPPRFFFHAIVKHNLIESGYLLFKSFYKLLIDWLLNTVKFIMIYSYRRIYFFILVTKKVWGCALILGKLRILFEIYFEKNTYLRDISRTVSVEL